MSESGDGGAPSKLKRGDYLVHIFIQDGRGFVGSDPESATDPRIQMTCLGDTQYSKEKEDVGSGASVYWGEHFFFEKKAMEVEDVQDSIIKIDVIDSGTFSKELIGGYTLDVPTVYDKPDHAIQSMWLALSNTTSGDFQKVRGYLLVSISVTGEGDDQVELKKMDQSQGDGEVLMPPQIQQESHQVHIRLYNGEEFPAMDFMTGKLDPFIRCEFLEADIKGDVVKNNRNPQWNQELLLPANIPVVTDKMYLKLYDYDAIGSNELVGTFKFSFKKLRKGEYNEPFWANCYGAPPDESGSAADRMNRLPQTASCWKGRMLLRMFTAAHKNPLLKCKAVEDKEDLDRVQEILKERNDWDLMAEIYQGVGIIDKKVKIVIQWADKKVETTQRESKKGYVPWYQLLDIKGCKFPVPHDPKKEVKALPDIFVYLNDGKRNVCFLRLKPSSLVKGGDSKWFTFNPDMAVGEVAKFWKAGQIRMRLHIAKSEEAATVFTRPQENKLKRPKHMKKWLLHCNIFQGRNLPAGDDDGRSDPFCKIRLDGDEIQTNVIENTINPVWYERQILAVSFDEISQASKICMQIFDSDDDAPFDSDDLLGVAYIDLSDAEEFRLDERAHERVDKESIIQRPKWYPINMGRPGTEMGEMLCSFNLFEDDIEIEDVDIAPKTEECEMELNVLGLRGLQTLGILPINKAFVKFDINSLYGPGQKIQSKSKAIIKTQPREVGASPNIIAIIKCTIRLPKDPIFCPSLACTVYDYTMGGWSQPMLGSFSIPMADIVHNIINTLKDNFDTERKFRKELDQFLDKINRKVSPSKEGDTTIDMDAYSSRSVDTDGGELAINRSGEAEMVEGVNKEKEEEKKEEEDPFDFAEKVKDPEKEGSGEKKDEHPIDKFVIYPKYFKNSSDGMIKEISKPDPELYMEMGWDPAPVVKGPQDDSAPKHYRYVIRDELEFTNLIEETPFDVYGLARGQNRGLEDGFFSSHSKDTSGESSDIKDVGKFKAMISVTSSKQESFTEKIDHERNLQEEIKKEIKDVYEENKDMLNKRLEQGDQTRVRALSKAVANTTEIVIEDEREIIRKKLLAPTKCLIRVYVIDAFQLRSKDHGGESDPYLVLTLGKKKISDRDNYLEDNSTPHWYKMFELETEFPGPSLLGIKVFDWDLLGGDELIGQTIVDLEDRFFQKAWNDLPNKPIETRSLLHPSSRIPQGQLRCFVEIFPTSLPKDQILNWQIAPKPPAEFQLRFIVWRTTGVKCMDAEGVSDVYVRCFTDDCEAQETDTHWRAQKGAASFNWRMLYNFVLPRDRNTITVQLWDRDIFSGNDFIADATLDFSQLAEEAFAYDRVVKKFDEGHKKKSFGKGKKAREEKFWIPCFARDKDTGEMKQEGRVQCSLELMPVSRANASRVGRGREDPNQNPWLPPPAGRFKWSLNPCTMLMQTVGPEYRAKIYCLFCAVYCVAICFFLAPVVLGGIIADIMNPLNWF